MFLSTTRAVIPPRAAEGATIWPVAAPPNPFKDDPFLPCLQNMFLAENLENTEMHNRREQLT